MLDEVINDLKVLIAKQMNKQKPAIETAQNWISSPFEQNVEKENDA